MPTLAKSRALRKGVPNPSLGGFRPTFTMCMCFFCGFGIGWCCCASQLPEPFFGIFSYVHAIKIIAWDYAGTTQTIQRITGIPIYSASIGIVLVGGGAIWKGFHSVLDTTLERSLPAFRQQSTFLMAAE